MQVLDKPAVHGALVLLLQAILRGAIRALEQQAPVHGVLVLQLRRIPHGVGVLLLPLQEQMLGEAAHRRGGVAVQVVAEPELDGEAPHSNRVDGTCNDLLVRVYDFLCLYCHILPSALALAIAVGSAVNGFGNELANTNSVEVWIPRTLRRDKVISLSFPNSALLHLQEKQLDVCGFLIWFIIVGLTILIDHRHYRTSAARCILGFISSFVFFH